MTRPFKRKSIDISKGGIVTSLASSSGRTRIAGAKRLCRALCEGVRPPEADGLEILAKECELSWRAIEVDRASVVDALVTVFMTDGNLMLIECIAIALGTEGDAGLAELLGLLEYEEFAVRSKVVTGIAAAGSRARGVVNSLLELIVQDPAPLVVTDALDALGRIGGEEAKSMLLSLILDGDFEFGDLAQEALDKIVVEEFVASLQ